MQPDNPPRLPYSMTPQYSEERFNDVYNKALNRKKLFKEYISRHKVLEKMNAGIEEMFDSDQLPDDPMAFLAKFITTPGGIRANSAAADAAGGKFTTATTNVSTSRPLSAKLSPTVSARQSRNVSPLPGSDSGSAPPVSASPPPPSIAAKVSPRPTSATGSRPNSRPTSARR
eukprot:gene18699-25221_t